MKNATSTIVKLSTQPAAEGIIQAGITTALRSHRAQAKPGICRDATPRHRGKTLQWRKPPGKEGSPPMWRRGFVDRRNPQHIMTMPGSETASNSVYR